MKKTNKERDIIEEATDMYNDFEDNEMEDMSGLGGADEDIVADEDEDFMDIDTNDLDGLDELDEVGDMDIQEPLQAAADAIQGAADAAGVELTAGMEDEMMGDEDMLGMEDEMMGDEEDLMGDEEMGMGGEDMGMGGAGMTPDEMNMEAYENIMQNILKEETPAWARSQKSSKSSGAKNSGNWDKNGQNSPAKSHNGSNEQIPVSRRNKPEAQAQDGVDGAPEGDGVSAPTKLNVGAKKISPAKSHNGSNEQMPRMNKNVSVPGQDDDGFKADIEVNTSPTGEKETAVGGEPVNMGAYGTGANGGFVNQKMVNLAASYKPDADFNKKAEAIFESTMKKHFSKKVTT